MSTQDWPGEAAVDVSIVNWVKAPAEPPTRFVLDEVPVEGIDTALEESTIPIADVPAPYPPIEDMLFRASSQGRSSTFDVSQAEALLARTEATYGDVVKPYLDGRMTSRTLDQRPTRLRNRFRPDDARRCDAVSRCPRDRA